MNSLQISLLAPKNRHYAGTLSFSDPRNGESREFHVSAQTQSDIPNLRNIAEGVYTLAKISTTDIGHPGVAQAYGPTVIFFQGSGPRQLLPVHAGQPEDEEESLTPTEGGIGLRPDDFRVFLEAVMANQKDGVYLHVKEKRTGLADVITRPKLNPKATPPRVVPQVKRSFSSSSSSSSQSSNDSGLELLYWWMLFHDSGHQSHQPAYQGGGGDTGGGGAGGSYPADDQSQQGAVTSPEGNNASTNPLIVDPFADPPTPEPAKEPGASAPETPPADASSQEGGQPPEGAGATEHVEPGSTTDLNGGGEAGGAAGSGSDAGDGASSATSY